MMHNRTGVNLDVRQLDYIRDRSERAAFLQSGQSSPADKLSAYFQQPGVSHISYLLLVQGT